MAGAVYSPHIYTFIFGMAEDRGHAGADDLRPSLDNARRGRRLRRRCTSASRLRADRDNADLWMRWQQELHDEYLASSAFWLWKEDSQGAWGLRQGRR